MKKFIPPPSDRLFAYVDNIEQNVVNLYSWLELLCKPFMSHLYSDYQFSVESIFDSTYDIDNEEDPYPGKKLIKIYFPTTVYNLYNMGDASDYDFGHLFLYADGTAVIFSEANHSVEKYNLFFKDMKGEMKTITGTWEEIADIYFQYLSDLMAVPVPYTKPIFRLQNIK